MPVDATDTRVERYAALDAANRPYLEWQIEQFRPFLGRRVLEIGCGVGSITDLIGSGELVHCLDVEEDVLAFARRRFQGRSGYAFSLLDITRASEAELRALEAEHFDSAVCINVLEHVENDEEALHRMARVLRPGGTLALLVPAHPILYGRWDELEGHFRRYTKRGLERLLEKTGLEIESLRRFNAVGAIGWWIQYKLLRQAAHDEGHFGVMNRLVPLMRRIERAVPPPFGLSLVAVGRKGGSR